MLIIFGDKLKELRIQYNLTQNELAKILNVSKTTICQWETHKQEASLEDIINIAKYFDETADYLLGLEDDFGIINYDNATCPILYTKEEHKLLKEYRSLPSGGKQLIHQVISAWKKDRSE